MSMNNYECECVCIIIIVIVYLVEDLQILLDTASKGWPKCIHPIAIFNL